MKTKEAIERVRSRFSKWALDDEDLTALQTLGLVDVESEDEKIRKEIIDYLGLVGKGKGDYAQPMIDRWIAYLEKQKEQKPTKKFDVDAAFNTREPRDNWEYIKEFCDKFGRIPKDMDELDVLVSYVIDKKQKEHKPVISDEAIREGVAHFGITQYQIDNWLKKHINVVEQKPAQYDLDVLEKHITKDSISELAHTVMIRNGWDIVEQEQKPEEKPINWTELTWEDINELEDIINKVHYEFRNGIGQIHFGKEVLERFREYKGDEYLDGIEEKPVEWSEEDENAITTAIRACRYMTENFENSTKQYEDAMERLKSLRPHWKPSEEQMGALNYAYCELFKREDVGHNILGPLQNLIDTLSKL